MNAAVVPFRAAMPAPAAPVPPLPVHPTDRILRLPAVRQRIPLSVATIYRRIAAGQFPKPVPLGARAVGWRESEINALIAKGMGGGA
jgi:prophage regulatory protein